MPSDSTQARGPNTRAGAPGEVLRILVIDESPRDRALIAESLRNGLPESEVAEIQDPAELSAALERADFDVVLADHRPSWIDAFLVLGKARERHPDLPVILCTATGSEELAVAAMKAGFDDYVLKHPHHFPRLVSAIRSALADAERRCVEREAETRYRTLFEGVPVGLYRSTPTGQVLDANPALLRMLGYPSREILMASNLCSLYVDHKAHDRMRRHLDKEGEVKDLEISWKCYGGQLIWVRENIRAVRDQRGRLLGYEGLVEDITERRARARSSRSPTSSARRSSPERAKASSSTTARCAASSGTATWKSSRGSPPRGPWAAAPSTCRPPCAAPDSSSCRRPWKDRSCPRATSSSRSRRPAAPAGSSAPTARTATPPATSSGSSVSSAA